MLWGLFKFVPTKKKHFYLYLLFYITKSCKTWIISEGILNVWFLDLKKKIIIYKSWEHISWMNIHFSGFVKFRKFYQVELQLRIIIIILYFKKPYPILKLK